MEEGADLSRGVFIVGEISGWKITPLDSKGDLVFSKTLSLTPGGDTLAYYYLTTGTWDNYLDFRESVPSECALRWGSDRGIIVPPIDTLVDHLWGSCSQIGSSTVSIAEIMPPSDEYILYPNPAQNLFYIKLSDPLKHTAVRIYEISGKEVHSNISHSTGSELSISVQNLSNGIYIVSIEHDGSYLHKKLLINRMTG